MMIPGGKRVQSRERRGSRAPRSVRVSSARDRVSPARQAVDVEAADWSRMVVRGRQARRGGEELLKPPTSVEVENRVDARNTLPPAYRTQARILGLNKFSLEEIDALLKQHGG